ncbi:unnamed protein product [Allacma fusca]|uniref:Uncharacterized protein n=1 Tax=Allacma fusca TaxID=39272 RepID=A0A8J2KYV2_9HEXA|nr:unnamed protein product [Allacma fusca]
MSSVLALALVAVFSLACGQGAGEVVGVGGLVTPPGGTLIRGVPRAMMEKSPYFYFYRPRGFTGLQKPVEEEGLVNLRPGPLVARAEEPLIPPREVPVTGVYRQYSNLGQYGNLAQYPESTLYGGYGYSNLPYNYGYPYYYGTTIGYGYGLPQPQLVGGGGQIVI